MGIEFEEVVEPQYYVNFDQSGNIAGFYVDAIHGDNIPETAIPITIEEWQTYCAETWKWKRDGDVIREKTPEEIAEEIANQPPVPKSPIQELQEENAALWYDIMIKEARIAEHDNEIADLWYKIMMGGI